jgi:hypothetical protein
MDKVQRALQDTLAAEEAEELLGAAGDHYRDAAVTCLIQWGESGACMTVAINGN